MTRRRTSWPARKGRRRDASLALQVADAALGETREVVARLEERIRSAEERAAASVDQVREAAGHEPDEVPEALSFDPATIREPAAYEDEIRSLRAERDRIGPVNLRAEADIREVREAREALASDPRRPGGGAGEIRGRDQGSQRRGPQAPARSVRRGGQQFPGMLRDAVRGGRGREADADRSGGPIRSGPRNPRAAARQAAAFARARCRAAKRRSPPSRWCSRSS